MTTRHRSSAEKLVGKALPLALLCVIVSVPANAVPIDSTASASAATGTQLAKTDKQAIQAARKAEKQARKAYLRCMKQARKSGNTASCKPSSSETPAVAANAVTVSAQLASPLTSQPEESAPEAVAPAATVRPASSARPAPSVSGAPLMATTAIPPSMFMSKTDGGESAIGLMSTAAPVAAVPEPGSLALLGAGLLGLSLAARRRKQTAA